MITASVRYKEETYRALLRLEQQLKSNNDKACAETADDLVKHIRSNWSAAPSSAGERPAVRDGTLDDGVRAVPQGRDELGKFRGANSSVYFVELDTSDAGRGQYAIAVDNGNSIFNAKPRPYIDESLDAVADQFISNLKAKPLKGS